ncbi:hypothetical protein CEUSTIGMA_g10209.t1 [Chlamydomonas eustigma]|uniref:SET domain-containing protein n=1 Tax=Chlamydomonas eustigma TaxID=1157962 RepID=A0A250XIB5_9CHLO|nr:hypothetical protein CEUSTIGMA_g10209.t1 [Chlamydomonas eustigma]|eukprot:GAX82783.1 hypothetical protein CEUSTIGMA_g10209.t1 [Chlamydomonas eustigma]
MSQQQLKMNLEVREHPRKGRCLFTMQLFRAGEVVFEEEPLLLVVAPENCLSTCAFCIRSLSAGKSNITCLHCNQACFCSPSCAQQAASTSWSHGPDICRAYQVASRQAMPCEDLAVYRFLVHALKLREIQGTDPDGRYQRLCSLVGAPSAADAATVQRLIPLLEHALGGLQQVPGLTPEELAALVRKEQLNSYGIMADPWSDGERRIKGSGLYQKCALINHECNPNTARCDVFDGTSVRMTLRAMHDLPPGSEVTISYCPLSWSYEERQQQCRSVYGFICNCPRCQAECLRLRSRRTVDDSSEWETESSSDAMEEDDGGAEAQTQEGASTSNKVKADEDNDDEDEPNSYLIDLPPNTEEGPLDPTYLQIYLMKYACSRPQCYGTLVPLPSSSLPSQLRSPNVPTLPASALPEGAMNEPSQLFECNVCCFQRTEEQFLVELEQGSGHNH